MKLFRLDQAGVSISGFRATTSPVRCSWLVLVALLITETSLVAQEVKPNCQCRAPGGVMRDLGTVECFDIVGHRYLVICDMSTNTPYWRKLHDSEGCPSA